MFLNRRRPRLARVAAAGAAALLAVGLIAACGGSDDNPGQGGGASPSAATAAAAAGGTARVALPPGVDLNYIWPYTPVTGSSEYNSEGFQMLMYRPLYMFGNNGQSVTVNYPLSPAKAPVYSDGNKTVTITMKGWKWSNGETVNAADVVFWLNMMKAEPASFYGYVPGLFPDNLSSYGATGPNTVVLHLRQAVSDIWFTYNQLSEITPMPAAWDVTSAGAKAGSGDCATDTAADKWAKCKAVYAFMSGEAKNAKAYATSPLWSVVDGPWKLDSFSTAGSGPVASFVPNTAYSGSPRPQLAGFTYYAYTDDTTEYTALRTGQLDVGFVPPQDLAPVSPPRVLPPTNPLGSAYSLTPAYQFAISFMIPNMNNPTTGPIFRQLYARQAMQELSDQVGMVKAGQRGYGYPTSGGVPSQPKTLWVSSVQEQNGGQGPYPFSVANAVKLLTDHGWKNVGGVMTCESPGSGAGRCGAGVKPGQQFAFTLNYATGVAFFQQEVAVYRSDAARAGIKVNLVPQSFGTVVGEAIPCRPSQPSCQWDMLSFGGWNFNGPGFQPTGEPPFQTGSGSNAGSYSDPQMDKLINLTHTSDSLSVFQQYATYVADQVPDIWLPNLTYIQAVSSKLANVGFNPLFTTLPEYWNFTK